MHPSSRAPLLLAVRGEESEESILKRRMLRRRRSRVRFVRSLHGAFRISISGALALNRALLPSASYPFVPFIQRPSVSRRLLPTSPFFVIPPSLFLSRQICPPSCLFARESRRYVAIFCRFYFGEHLVAGMRTKGTCSLRKSSRRRQEGGSRTRLGLFTCS